ncbi:MAG TPA: DUF2934 domain-containing protein [Bryobacteraceae bacterium]|jgi:hypothetical protein|nr:DUF2934 domain-containing protein [Bryobacteraceae bacterium]
MSPRLQKHSHPAVNATEVEITESLEEVDTIVDRETRIRSRAYELYLGRGQEPGFELDDWL